MYFNTRHGCIKGDACTFLHVLTSEKQAKLDKQLQNNDKDPEVAGFKSSSRKVVMLMSAKEETKQEDQPGEEKIQEGQVPKLKPQPQTKEKPAEIRRVMKIEGEAKDEEIIVSEGGMVRKKRKIKET